MRLIAVVKYAINIIVVAVVLSVLAVIQFTFMNTYIVGIRTLASN